MNCATCGAPPDGMYQDGSPWWKPTHPHRNEQIRGDDRAPKDERIIITLTVQELQDAAAVGRCRWERDQALDVRLLPTYDPEDVVEFGCQAELAVSKWSGLKWASDCKARDRGAPDLGRIHVRARRSVDYDLIVRKSRRKVAQDAREPYLLVVGRRNYERFWIRGWILGGDARNDKWLADHGGHGEAYFVPPAALRDPVELVTTHRAVAGLPPIGVE